MENKIISVQYPKINVIQRLLEAMHRSIQKMHCIKSKISTAVTKCGRWRDKGSGYIDELVGAKRVFL